MYHMYEGIVNFTLLLSVLVISGAVLYEPIDLITSSIASVAPDAGTANFIAGLSIYFVGSIAFAIMCAFAWLFLWGHKFEYERY